MSTLDYINQFLNGKRFALVGLSRNPREFSRTLFKEFKDRGYDVVPVNPAMEDVDGVRCFSNVKEIDPKVTSALVMTSKKATAPVVRDCVEEGIELVWLFGIAGEKEVDRRALDFCRERGIKVIPGYCPYMFLPQASFFHRFHGSVWKFVGLYPR